MREGNEFIKGDPIVGAQAHDGEQLGVGDARRVHGQVYKPNSLQCLLPARVNDIKGAGCNDAAESTLQHCNQ